MSVWLLEHPWMQWLAATVVLGLCEMLLMEFSCLMLAVAAVVAGLVSLAAHGPWPPVITFAVVSFLLFLLVRPGLLARLNRSTPETLSNADGLVGRSVAVLEPVGAETGLVRLAGDVWTARSAGEPIDVGQPAVVARIDGATAVVRSERTS